MRQNPKPRTAQLSPRRIFTSIPLLICEGRTPDSAKGKIEGPHAADVFAPPPPPPSTMAGETYTPKHICCRTNPICSRAEAVGSRATELWDNSLPLCLQLILVPSDCAANDRCLSQGYLLETWTIECKPRRGCDDKALQGPFLLQAIRSHLHFSQLTAWLLKSKGKLGCKLVYKVSLPGEAETGGCSDGVVAASGDVERHQFPACRLDDSRASRVLTVTLQTVAGRTAQPPDVICALCSADAHSSETSPSTSSGSASSTSATVVDVSTTQQQPSPIGSGANLGLLSLAVASSLHQQASTGGGGDDRESSPISAMTTVRLSPIVLPPPPPPAVRSKQRRVASLASPSATAAGGVTSVDNPLFGVNECHPSPPSTSDFCASSSASSAGVLAPSTTSAGPSSIARGWEVDLGRRLQSVNLTAPPPAATVGPQRTEAPSTGSGQPTASPLGVSSEGDGEYDDNSTAAADKTRQTRSKSCTAAAASCLFDRSEAERLTVTPEKVKFYIDASAPPPPPAQSCPSSSSKNATTRKKDSCAAAACCRTNQQQRSTANVRTRRKRQNSQKILFSDDNDFKAAISDSSHSESPSLLLPDEAASTGNNANESPVFQKLNPVKSPKRRANRHSQHELEMLTRKSSFTGEATADPLCHYSRSSKASRKEVLLSKRFSAHTGLPLTSSPAPLKRNQHSFDYDHTLSSVSGLKYAFYNQEHDSGSSDSESGSFHCKSAPASTGLLGNFEESALNGRIKPFGSVDGFLLDLAASGAFCPAHVMLPVTTFYFNLNDDNAPAPYLGHCRLDSIGRKGYHVPKKGTVQATLFNPQGTVVKMFVVRYDLCDMPADSQTFVRQRTFFMPSTASPYDARRNRSWLRYLIHLRFQSSRSGKLYLHTDIRMLFSRKSELDVYNLDLDAGSGPPSSSCSRDDTPNADIAQPGVPAAASSSSGGGGGRTFELRSFTQMPNNPKFSPRKCGSARCATAVDTPPSLETTHGDTQHA